jgi:hypothetical protein
MLLRGRATRLAFVSPGQITFFAGITLLTAFVVGGSGYLIRELHRQAGAAWSAAGLPAALAPAVTKPMVTGDMLHVSSIALGREPIAVVNGVIVSQGVSVQLQLPEGNAVLQVARIRDGAVDFRYLDQTISVNLGHARPSKR